MGLIELIVTFYLWVLVLWGLGLVIAGFVQVSDWVMAWEARAAKAAAPAPPPPPPHQPLSEREETEMLARVGFRPWFPPS